MAKVLSINTFGALLLMHIKTNGCLLLIQSLHYKAALYTNRLKGKGENKGTEIWTSLSVLSLPPTVSSSSSFEKFLEGSVDCDHHQYSLPHRTRLLAL